MKLATLNLEGTKHLPDQLTWIEREKPDVLCVQECFRVSLPEFAKLGYFAQQFVPLLHISQENPFRAQTLGDWGIAVLSRWPIRLIEVKAYRGQLGQLSELVEPNSPLRAVLVVEVENEEQIFRVAVVHHTRTPDGDITPEQRRDTLALLKILEPYPSLILCGDFNAARGKEAWSMLEAKYRDNVPPEVKSTIDGTLHYAGDLQLVVDGIFSTPDYRVENVRVHTGVSDHCGLTAEILSHQD